MNEIKKPLMVARKDFANDLTMLVQDSGLPLCVIEPIVKDLLQLLYHEMERQEQAERQMYEKQLSNNDGELNE